MTNKNYKVAKAHQKKYDFTLECQYETDSGKSIVVKSVSDILYAEDIIDAYAKCMNIAEQLTKMDPLSRYEITSITRVGEDQ